jgi:hypothetical protein
MSEAVTLPVVKLDGTVLVCRARAQRIIAVVDDSRFAKTTKEAWFAFCVDFVHPKKSEKSGDPRHDNGDEGI